MNRLLSGMILFVAFLSASVYAESNRKADVVAEMLEVIGGDNQIMGGFDSVEGRLY